ncbi:EthD domain-containing protein [Corallococcus sp. BB11-1]|uniref:EthD domain-containing protein n=1 Tax=Corallococcus sp. BB11-1 TaxID=2996783 RepID=UPI00226D5FC2|nr:EthD domain-containing protein [Corallococcus sp. BB11-1]MCY1034800.1 EthD domain-containing protein [Corallococcus sp. BB11-1]
MLKVLVFLTKKQDLETQAFIEYYEKNHVPLVCGLAPPPIVYKRNFLVRGDALNMDDGSIDFDVVTEMVFPDRETFHAWGALLFAPSNGDAIAKDEQNFLERSRTRAYVVEERVTTSG